MDFFIDFAFFRVRITSDDPLVFKRCERYIAPVSGFDFAACSRPEFEKEVRAREPDFKSDYVEFLCIYRDIAEKIVDYGAFVMHGAAIEYGGKGYIFTGPSGIGKTTRARLFAGAGAEIVNGDKPVLRILGDRVYVCGTPWAGRENLGKPLCVPLCGIFIVSRADGEEPKCEPLTPYDAFGALVNQVYLSSSASGKSKTVALLGKVLDKVGVFALSGAPDERLLAAAKAAMGEV